MEEKKQKILEFLKGDIILSWKVKQELKEGIANFTEDQLDGFLELFPKLQAKQAEILKEKVSTEPWLFTKLEVVASRGIYNEHRKEEKTDLSRIEKFLLQQLQTL